MVEIIKVDETTWRIENEFVRFFLLTGYEKAVLIDSGFNCPDAKEIAESLTDLPITLLNTHGDGDHTSGTAAFTEIYMGVADYVNQKMSEKFPDTDLVAVSDGDRIHLGGRNLEIVSIPGHTLGSIAVLDVEKRVLYAGDSVQDGHIFLFGGHRAPEKFEAALLKLVDMEDRFDTVIGSHGTPELPGDFVRKVLESWREVLDKKIEPVEMEMHGNMIHSYDAKYCGFYCE